MKESSLTTITLKKINKANVYQYIYKEKTTSKMQIVQDLKMGLSTVSQNLTDLEKDGLIERKGYFDSTGGRKAQAIQIVPDFKLSIGVGILKDMFHIAVVDLYGETVSVDTFPVSYSSTDSYYEAVTDKIKQIIADNHYAQEQILGVSIATQGIISTDGSAVTYGAIMGNSDMKLSDFSHRLPYPCRLEHDSKAAAALELWNHSDCDSSVVFLLNRNLGGAIIANHKIHPGMSMHSGSIEHLCIDPDGPLCYCGSHGCLETYCSANALESAAGMSVKDFFAALREKKDTKAWQLWYDYLTHLAFAMRNLNMVIDSPIIISGYLAPYFTDDDIAYLLEDINRSTPFFMDKTQILTGTHGQYTPAVGASLFYVEQFIQGI